LSITTEITSNEFAQIYHGKRKQMRRDIILSKTKEADFDKYYNIEDVNPAINENQNADEEGEKSGEVVEEIDETDALLAY